MDPLYILLSALILLALVLVLWSWGKARHRAEAATTEALVEIALKAIEDADRINAARARAIEADQAALAADSARVTAARSRLAGNAAPAA